MERRASIEVRAKGKRLEGYAAVFDTETRIADFIETISPGAFSSSLAARRDVLALCDHDPARVLARTRSGTLRLSEDTRGLSFDIDVPETSAGRDVLALAERGDLGGMSFGFTVRKDGEEWRGDRRELKALNLIEVSVVSAFPAYAGTSVQARMTSQRCELTPRLALARRFMDSL
jgi:HK97 family phage prohead protease